MVPIEENINQVSCSGFHTAAVSESGRIYAWGRSDFGRCGVKQPISHRGEGDTVPIWRPKLVQGIQEPMKRVSAGGFFTIAVAKDGRSVFSFGGNGNGELGIGSKTKFEWEPQKVQLDDTLLGNGEVIDEISTGGFHTCLLTSKGRLLAFGDNHSNQLGMKSNLKFAARPSNSDALEEAGVTGVSCGPTYTTVVTDKTKLWLLGGAPGAPEPQLVFEAAQNQRLSLPEKQGAHHILFFVE
jgi:alpha-tubulin suppressor-like RCC1 family protein